MTISEHAAGKWPQIIAALIGERFTNRRKHWPCPRGEGTDRFRFSDKFGTGNFFCACSAGERDGFDLIRCVHGVTFAQAAAMVESVIGAAPGGKRSTEATAEAMETFTIGYSRYEDWNWLPACDGHGTGTTSTKMAGSSAATR